MQSPNDNQITTWVRLTLLAAPSLEEPLVDFLLETNPELEFTLGLVLAHASGHETLSLVEQVSGRKKRIRLEVVGESSLIEELKQQLKGGFAGANLSYSIESLSDHGSI